MVIDDEHFYGHFAKISSVHMGYLPKYVVHSARGPWGYP